jgi:hypothetical protein
MTTTGERELRHFRFMLESVEGALPKLREQLREICQARG